MVLSGRLGLQLNFFFIFLVVCVVLNISMNVEIVR